MKKLLSVVIALMMMVTFVFAEEAAPAEVKTLYAGVLTVGCEAGYPPFEMVADDGESVVGLDTLHPDAPAGIPLYQLFEEISGGIGALLGVCSQEAQTGIFIYGRVLEQSQLRVCNTPAGYHLHIHLDPLAGIGHLLVRLGFVCFFRLLGGKQPQFAHHTKQALWTAGITAFLQTVPELDHAQCWISAAHVADELQFGFRVLVWVTVRPSGLAGQGRFTSVPALSPEIDIRAALVVLPAGTADAVLFRVLHQGLTVFHVLCYTFVHEGYGLLSPSCGVVTQL